MPSIYHNPHVVSYTTPLTSLPDPRSTSFHRQLPGYNPTPLRLIPHSLIPEYRLTTGCVLLKDESERLGLPAFKILGASWGTYRAVTQRLGLGLDVSLDGLARILKEKGGNITLFSATDGNHGRAVAWMAKLLELKCEIYIPQGLHIDTRELIAEEGARVIEVPGDYDRAVQDAHDAANKVQGILIQDTALEGYKEIPKWIVDGYSTIFAELDEQVPQFTGGRHADVIIVPVGVGSLAQAVVAHFKQSEHSSRTKVITVEPDIAACLKKSLLAASNFASPGDPPRAIQTVSTIMAGLNCATVSPLAWPLLKGGIDVAINVADIEAHRAVEDLQSIDIPVGPCGAAPLAALRHLIARSQNSADIVTPESVIVLLATEGPRMYTVPLDSTITDPIILTQILTRIDSSNPGLSVGAGAGEGAIAHFLFAWLTHHDFEAHWLERRPGRPSVVGVARGTGGGKALMFNGHIDTVTLAGYDGDPLSGEIIDGAVHGRGTFDMKAGIAASLVAALRARKSGEMKGDIILALVADEENLSMGTQEVFDAGWRADAAVVSEPTAHTLMLSHKGFVWAEVDIIGKAGHGSRPDLGVDAIVKAGHFLVALETYGETLTRGESDAVRHPELGTGTVHAGMIKGGEEVTSYPALCSISIERRTVPGETPGMVEAQLREILDKLAQRVADFRYALRMGESRPPYEVDKNNPFIELVARHAEDVLGAKPGILAGPYWTDSALLAEKGIPMVLFGVQGDGAHAAKEWATAASIEKVAETLTKVAMEFCG
ncbi:hypothetical protein AcW1_002393 [Taiwanofungus camphoratus]|nr:hypothetical protein AcW1_002393 [Antrodia cinnamomea]